MIKKHCIQLLIVIIGLLQIPLAATICSDGTEPLIDVSGNETVCQITNDCKNAEYQCINNTCCQKQISHQEIYRMLKKILKKTKSIQKDTCPTRLKSQEIERLLQILTVVNANISSYLVEAIRNNEPSEDVWIKILDSAFEDFGVHMMLQFLNINFTLVHSRGRDLKDFQKEIENAIETTGSFSSPFINLDRIYTNMAYLANNKETVLEDIIYDHLFSKDARIVFKPSDRNKYIITFTENEADAFRTVAHNESFGLCVGPGLGKALAKITVRFLKEDNSAETVTNGTRVKRSVWEPVVTKFEPLSSEPKKTRAEFCKDVKKLEKFKKNQELTQSFRNLTNNNSTRVYRSARVKQAVKEAMKINIRGSDSISIGDIMSIIQTAGCQTFIYGGFLRDMFTGDETNDIDVLVSCPVAELVKLCDKELSMLTCKSDSQHLSLLLRGSNENENSNGITMDVTHVSFKVATSVERSDYTANGLVYDPKADILIDGTGKGIADACARVIQIPMPEEMWKLWATRRNVFRYFKLLEKNFTPTSEKTNSFIMGQAMKEISKSKLPLKMRPVCKYVNKDGEITWPIISSNCEETYKRVKRETSECSATDSFTECVTTTRTRESTFEKVTTTTTTCIICDNGEVSVEITIEITIEYKPLLPPPQGPDPDIMIAK